MDQKIFNSIIETSFAFLVVCGLIYTLFFSQNGDAQFTRTKPWTPYTYDTSAAKIIYWNAWLSQIEWDTIALRQHQTFLDTLEDGEFVLRADTVIGRGSLRRTMFTWSWQKYVFADSVIVVGDTFSLPMLNYGSDIAKMLSDSLRIGETRQIVRDSAATECLRIEPVTISGSGTTQQTRIRVAKTGIVR